MKNKTPNVLFVLQVVLTAGLLILAIILFVNQNSLVASRIRESHSNSLADQLRQSSDDLTLMARAYVVTGKADYERRYWTILDIRNGKAPRPVAYDRIYWDLVTAPGEKPRPDGAPVSLAALMKEAGITDAEFAKLKQAQDNSDDLVKTEMIAMNAVKGIFKDSSGRFAVKGNPDREMAIRLMHDDAYFKFKKSIMKPIDEFYVLMGERTAKEVAAQQARVDWLLRLLITVIVLTLGMFLFSNFKIRKEMENRRRAEEELQRHRDNLEEVVAVRTRDLKIALEKEAKLTAEAAEAAIMKRKAEELRSLNQQLKASEQQLKASNQTLKTKEQALQASHKELTNKMSDLDQFNKLMVGRELEMIKLKQEVNALLEKQGQARKYEITG